MVLIPCYLQQLLRTICGGDHLAAWLIRFYWRFHALSLFVLQADMYARSSAEFEECKETATTWDDFMAALDRKHMVLAPW